MHKIGMWLMLALIGFAVHVVADEAADTCTGTVVSTENSGPYTYVQLNLGGSNVWYAIPSAEFKPGEQVVAPAGLPMKNFYSKTLDRTFDLVFFADGINRVGEKTTSDSLPAGHPPVATGLPAGHPAIQCGLPAGHPPIGATTNSACCVRTNEPTDCYAHTNAATQ